MKKNPEIIKELAQKINSHPRWTGADGVFFNRFAGYRGVKLFAEYVKHLRRMNGNKIPGSLNRRKDRSYFYYLNELPEDKKAEYSSYFKNVVPRMPRMIRDSQMTEKSILEFANIFNELEIGHNPATIIADYQTAISEAFKFKMHAAEGSGSSDDSQSKSYRQLSLSDSEKESVIQTCSQGGVVISSSHLDGYYVGSEGSIYTEDGEAVANPVIGAAIVQTLQYQVSIGNAEKLALTNEEITKILVVCERKGIKITKEDLENLHIDKGGQLYSGDGKVITDVGLGTEIKQTKTYADAYDKFADKRGESGVAEVPVSEEDMAIPALVDASAIKELSAQIKPLEGTDATKAQAARSAAKGEEGAAHTTREKAGLANLPKGEGMSSMGIEGSPLNKGQAKKRAPKWLFDKDGLRQQMSQANAPAKMPAQEGPEKQVAGKQPGQSPEEQQAQLQQKQVSQRKTEDGGGTPPFIPIKKSKWKRKVAIPLAGGTLGYKTIAATFFIPANFIDNHYFIHNILTILFQ